MFPELNITIMSGVEDGASIRCGTTDGDGERISTDGWRFMIGRHKDNDVCLSHDTFVSRHHAFIYWENGQWWLEDHNSTNGTFIETDTVDQFLDARIHLLPGQLFRIGRTWLRIDE